MISCAGFGSPLDSSLANLPSERTTERIPKRKKPVRRNQGQQDGDRLPKLDRPGDRRPAQSERCEETQLDAVGLVVCDPVASEAV